MGARLDAQEYHRCLSVLKTHVDVTSLRSDGHLHNLLEEMMQDDTYTAVCCHSFIVGQHIQSQYFSSCTDPASADVVSSSSS